MNAGIENKPFLEGWVWLLAAFALALIVGAIYWSGHPGDGPRTDTDINRLAPIEGEPVHSVMAPNPPPVPSVGVMPFIPDEVEVHSPSVTVTEVRPAPAPKHLPKLTGSAEPKTNPVSDMFPVGRIADPPAPRAEAEVEAQAPPDLPSFEYDGRTWSYTGESVSADSLDLAPVCHSVGDRRVCVLAGDGAPGDVLFVQGATEAGDYAIYRQG